MESKEKFLAAMVTNLNLGFKLSDLRDIEGRKFLQKATYLIQEEIPAIKEKPVWLGFHYNLYLHGPYSPALADLGYEILNNIDGYENIDIEEFSEENERKRIQTSAGFIKKSASDLDLGTDWLGTMELLTTTHFLYFRSFEHLKGTNRAEETTKRCCELKPGFSLEQCKRAVELLID